MTDPTDLTVKDLAEMDDQRAAELVATLLCQWHEARASIGYFERRASGLRKVLDGIVTMFPETGALAVESIQNGS